MSSTANHRAAFFGTKQYLLEKPSLHQSTSASRTYQSCKARVEIEQTISNGFGAVNYGGPGMRDKIHGSVAALIATSVLAQKSATEFIRHSGQPRRRPGATRNPVKSRTWMPAFAGMTMRRAPIFFADFGAGTVGAAQSSPRMGVVGVRQKGAIVSKTILR